MFPLKSGLILNSGHLMALRSPIFEETYKNYLAQVARIDLKACAVSLGIQAEGQNAVIPFFKQPYRLSPTGVLDPSGQQPAHAVSVVLCKYLLRCPTIEPQGDNWVSFKDFKDAAPFVGGFVTNTERAIFIKFPGRLPALKDACLHSGGLPVDLGLSYDLSIRFEALPRIPMLFLFNDEDDEFPAQCAFLFQKKAEKYLDMECLAILGWFLTDSLLQAAGESQTTIM
jgi:Domain of unknown function (DUF3786)